MNFYFRFLLYSDFGVLIIDCCTHTPFYTRLSLFFSFLSREICRLLAQSLIYSIRFDWAIEFVLWGKHIHTHTHTQTNTHTLIYIDVQTFTYPHTYTYTHTHKHAREKKQKPKTQNNSALPLFSHTVLFRSYFFKTVIKKYFFVSSNLHPINFEYANKFDIILHPFLGFWVLMNNGNYDLWIWSVPVLYCINTLLIFLLDVEINLVPHTHTHTHKPLFHPKP